MSVTFNPLRQCVIGFGRHHSLERSVMAADSWQIRAVSTQQPTDIGMRGEGTLVGVINLRERAEEYLEYLGRLLLQHRHTALLAIAPSVSEREQPEVARPLASYVAIGSVRNHTHRHHAPG